MDISMKSTLRFVKLFLFDNDRKPVFTMLSDLKKLKKENAYSDMSHYISCLMYKKDAGDVSNYLNRKNLIKIVNEIHHKNGKHQILSNKNMFRRVMHDNGLPIAQYLGMVKENQLIDETGLVISMKEKEMVIEKFNEWIKEHKTVFIKPVDSFGGKGILKIEEGSFFRLEMLVSGIEFIIEKGLVQHDELNKINPHCINTLRVVTVNIAGEIIIPNCFFRMGMDNSYVDNGSSGGIFLNYSIQNNSLDKVAYSLAKCGAVSYFSHPITNFIFKEKKLPYPHRIMELVTKAAQVFPDTEIIGWDIGYTNEGPVVIEGNENPDVTMTQIALRGLKNSPVYMKLYQSIII